jgi:hypothetical protein
VLGRRRARRPDERTRRSWRRQLRRLPPPRPGRHRRALRPPSIRRQGTALRTWPPASPNPRRPRLRRSRELLERDRRRLRARDSQGAAEGVERSALEPRHGHSLRRCPSERHGRRSAAKGARGLGHTHVSRARRAWGEGGSHDLKGTAVTCGRQPFGEGQASPRSLSQQEAVNWSSSGSRGRPWCSRGWQAYPWCT